MEEYVWYSGTNCSYETPQLLGLSLFCRRHFSITPPSISRTFEQSLGKCSYETEPLPHSHASPLEKFSNPKQAFRIEGNFSYVPAKPFVTKSSNLFATPWTATAVSPSMDLLCVRTRVAVAFLGKIFSTPDSTRVFTKGMDLRSRCHIKTQGCGHSGKIPEIHWEKLAASSQ